MFQGQEECWYLRQQTTANWTQMSTSIPSSCAWRWGPILSPECCLITFIEHFSDAGCNFHSVPKINCCQLILPWNVFTTIQYTEAGGTEGLNTGWWAASPKRQKLQTCAITHQLSTKWSTSTLCYWLYYLLPPPLLLLIFCALPDLSVCLTL